MPIKAIKTEKNEEIIAQNIENRKSPEIRVALGTICLILLLAFMAYKMTLSYQKQGEL